jgi:hypothetical protein
LATLGCVCEKSSYHLALLYNRLSLQCSS